MHYSAQGLAPKEHLINVDGVSKLMPKSTQPAQLNTSQHTPLKFWRVSFLQKQWLFRDLELYYRADSLLVFQLLLQTFLEGAGGTRDGSQGLAKVGKYSSSHTPSLGRLGNKRGWVQGTDHRDFMDTTRKQSRLSGLPFVIGMCVYVHTCASILQTDYAVYCVCVHSYCRLTRQFIVCVCMCMRVQSYCRLTMQFIVCVCMCMHVQSYGRLTRQFAVHSYKTQLLSSTANLTGRGHQIRYVNE